MFEELVLFSQLCFFAKARTVPYVALHRVSQRSRQAREAPGLIRKHAVPYHFLLESVNGGVKIL